MRIPSAATPINFFDICSGFKSYFNRDYSITQFQQQIAKLINCKYCFLTNSGTTSFYVVLKALRRFSMKDEVILPAYTSPSLVLPIKKLGLKVVLCDVSLNTFNLDIDKLSNIISSQTLCIVAVHMFGIPCDMQAIMKIAKENNIFVFEDSASSLGGYLDRQMVGAIGDAGCFSFNRGKNMTTFSGGCITTNHDDFAKAVEEELHSLEPLSNFSKFLIPFKLIALALVMRPIFYTLLYRLIVPFKSVTPHDDFHATFYTDFQAAVGWSLLKKLDKFSKAREMNGSILYEALKDIKNILLSSIIPGSIPAFNQFPILFKEKILRDKFHNELMKKGIDSTILYPKPIHRIYDLGFHKIVDPFPNATFLADRILLLPVHPFVKQKDLNKIIGVLVGKKFI